MTSASSMHEAGTHSRCSGTTQREWVGRKVGRGFRVGNTCVPMTDSCQCMAKTSTILQSNSLPIKIN